MNKQIIISFFFCLGIVVASAYPTEEFLTFDNDQNEEFNGNMAQNIFDLHREKRQFNFQIPTTSRPPISFDGTSISGSRGQGFDMNVNSRFPIWTSNNGRNSLDGSAGYQQHIGGPYGNSRPDYRGGLTFTHRF